MRRRQNVRRAGYSAGCVFALVACSAGPGNGPGPASGPTSTTAGKPRLKPPGPTTTGVLPQGRELARRGPLTIETAGQVVEGQDIRGALVIAADDVTVRQSRVTTGDYTAVTVRPGYRGVIVEDVEIVGQEGCAVGLAGLEGGAFTARRLNVSGCADGIKPGDDTLVENSWIHDMRVVLPGPGRPDQSHNDGIQVSGPLRNVTIRGNNFQNVGTNSSIQAKDDFGGGIDGLLIDGNWLEGGGYSLYIWNTTNVTVRDNRFRRSATYGAASILNNGGPFTQVGNVWDDNGEPLRLGPA